MRTLRIQPTSPLWLTLTGALAVACSSGAPAEPTEEASTESTGDEATAEGESDAAQAAPEEAAPAEPDAMQELQGKVIQLGVNRAALDRTLEGPQVDCKRAESQRDRICSLTDEICTGAEQHPEAQPQCDNARGKCDGAKAGVKRVRCGK